MQSYSTLCIWHDAGYYLIVQIEDDMVDLNYIQERNTNYDVDLCNKVVLVVDDIQINYLLIKALMKKSGATVLWAEDGFKALEIVESGRKIDMVLMDYNMPGINGYETTKLIKRRRQELPVISQTSYTFGKEFDNIIDAYDDIMFKPITSSKLFNMIYKHL